jgi:hypothetical protein
MGGKAALILVIGFSFMMVYTIMNLSTASTRSVRNMSKYSAMTSSHNLALAAANTALAKLYQDTSWGSAGHAEISQTIASGPLVGRFTASIDPVSGGGRKMVSVCWYKVESDTYSDTVEVSVTSSDSNSFSLYAWMTNSENGVFWITGDTVWGRVHSNDNITVSGSPAYLKKVTTSKGFIPPVGKSGKVGGTTYTNKAIFQDPPAPETGVAPITYPSDLSPLDNLAKSTSGKRYTYADTYVTLSPGNSSVNGDGKAYIRSTATGPILDSVSLGSASFNGVIEGSGVVHVQGTLDGKLTILSYSSASATTNNIKVDGNILLEKNPQTYPSSDDVLGLVANNNVIVTDNITGSGGRDIQASIFCRNGSFTAENYSSRGIDGTLRVLGSIVQTTRGAVGTFSGTTISNGFLKRYRYDDRLADKSFRPPGYPGFVRKTLAITNWWESYHLIDLRD